MCTIHRNKTCKIHTINIVGGGVNGRKDLRNRYGFSSEYNTGVIVDESGDHRNNNRACVMKMKKPDAQPAANIAYSLVGNVSVCKPYENCFTLPANFARNPSFQFNDIGSGGVSHPSQNTFPTLELIHL